VLVDLAAWLTTTWRRTRHPPGPTCTGKCWNSSWAASRTSC